MSEGGEGNIRFIKGAAYMRERERESIRLIAVCVRTSSMCATVLPQKRSAASARARARAQRRQHLELDAKCAPQMNAFIISLQPLAIIVSVGKGDKC